MNTKQVSQPSLLSPSEEESAGDFSSLSPLTRLFAISAAVMFGWFAAAVVLTWLTGL